MWPVFLFLLSSLSYYHPVPEVCPDSLPAASSISIDEAELLRQQYRQLMEAKNRPGSLSADFKFLNRNGEEQSLHSVNSDSDILLIFYDPDCDDCHAAIDSISKNSLDEKFRIIAIDAEEDRDRWTLTANSLPEEWTVGFAIDPIQDDETYYILSMPTLYLLDKDKKVILKDASLEDVLNL